MFDNIVSLADVIVTLAVAAIGWYFTQSFARQSRVTLADARRKAYAELWKLTELASLTRLSRPDGPKPLTLHERERLDRALTAWYYRDGNGMLLEKATRQLYLNAKHNLLCAPGDLKPRSVLICRDGEPLPAVDIPGCRSCDAFPVADDRGCTCEGCVACCASAPRGDREDELRVPLLALVRSEGMTDDADLRGCLSIRQLSLLRTQMKTDLAIYGLPWVTGLALHERAFLRCSGVALTGTLWGSLLTRIRLRGQDPWVDAAALPVRSECCRDTSGAPSG